MRFVKSERSRARKASSLAATGTILAAAVALSSANLAAAGCKGVKANHACITLCNVDTGIYIPFPKLISGIDLPTFSLNFDPAKGTSAASAPGTKVTLNVQDAAWLKSLGPLTKLEIIGVGGQIGVGPTGGDPVASISLPDYVPSKGILLDGVTTFDITNQAFNPVSAANTAVLFKALTLGSGAIPVRLSGYADTKIQIDALFKAKICARFVEVDVQSSLKGLGGLSQTTVTSIPKLVAGNPSTGLQLGVDLAIVNPSNINLALNTDVSLALSYQGSTIGSVVLSSFALGQGTNKYSASAFLNPDTKNAAAVAAAGNLISNFVGGKTSNVTVGAGAAKNLPILDAALGALNISQSLPGSAGIPLLSSGISYVNTLANGDDNGVPFLSFGSKVNGTNPFDIPVAITTIKTSIRYKNVACLTIDTTFNNFTLPAKGTARTPLFQVKLPNSEKGPTECTSDLLNDLLTNQKITVDTESQLTIAVGGYSTTFPYKQSGLDIVANFDETPTA